MFNPLGLSQQSLGIQQKPLSSIPIPANSPLIAPSPQLAPVANPISPTGYGAHVPADYPMSPDIEDRRNQGALSKMWGSTVNDVQDYGRRVQATDFKGSLVNAWRQLTK
jgi:hypothetical protein